MKSMSVYIMTNRSDTRHVGVTNDLERRVFEHKQGAGSGFTARYRIEYLVYVEDRLSPRDAIAREKQLKGRRREKKLALIEKSTRIGTTWLRTGPRDPGVTPPVVRTPPPRSSRAKPRDPVDRELDQRAPLAAVRHPSTLPGMTATRSRC